jgi:hypothetical protein
MFYHGCSPGSGRDVFPRDVAGMEDAYREEREPSHCSACRKIIIKSDNREQISFLDVQQEN